MYGNPNGLNVAKGIVGPWPCSECKELTQYADIGRETNYIFCRNPNCKFERIIDKRRNIIRENDGTFWKFDADGHKTRIRAQ
jgi:hypothetical protein